MIILGSWIFSLIVNIPLFLALSVKNNARCGWMNEEWIPKAYFLYWSAIVVVAMAIMAGLYSRIVYTLWFKRDRDNQLAFQQRVSINNQAQYGNSFLLINRRTGAGKIFQIFLPFSSHVNQVMSVTENSSRIEVFLVQRSCPLRGSVALGTRTKLIVTVLLAHYIFKSVTLCL